MARKNAHTEPFAVRARDVDDGRQPALRMPERFQRALDAVEHEVDALGMKHEQPFENAPPRRRIIAHELWGMAEAA